MDCRLSRVIGLLGVAVVLVLGGCGGGGDGGAEAAAGPVPDATRAASTPLPAHNPEARFGGKTVLEYAEGLGDLNPEVQAEALLYIGEFGVDGLPARDQVRAVIQSNAHEEIKLLAFAVLVQMQAPEVFALAREKLASPDVFRSDQAYASLLEALREAEQVDDATLLADMLRIAQNDLDHATRLMLLRELPDEAQRGLTRAVFEADHNEKARDYFLRHLAELTELGDEARINYVLGFVETDPDFAARLMMQQRLPAQVQQALTLAVLEWRDESQTIQTHSDQVLTYFFQHMGAMDFVSDDVKIAFIRDNSPFASRPQMIQRTHQILLSIGTQEAMDVALRYGSPMGGRHYQVMIQFAQAKVDPNVVFDRMLEDMQSSTVSDSINETGGYMELLVRQTGGSGEQGQRVQQRFIETMGTMVEDGPTDDHRAIAALYLISHVRQTRDVPVLPALEPVFAVISDTDAADIVRGTAGTHLEQAAREMAGREGFIERAVAAMWAGEDVHTTHFPQQILLAAGQNTQHVTRIVQAMLEDGEAHIESWSANPAAVVLLTVLRNREFRHTPIKTQGSVLLGKLLVSRHIHGQYLQDSIGRFFANYIGEAASPQHNTVEGIIAILEPFAFADHETVFHQNNPNNWAMRLVGNDTARAAIQQGPQAVELWRAFLQRVIDADRPHKGHAESGLARLEQEIQRAR